MSGARSHRAAWLLIGLLVFALSPSAWADSSAGAEHDQLPVPSVFLVDASGTILWIYSNPDDKVRPENRDLLEAAREAARGDGASDEAGDRLRESGEPG